MPYVINEYNKLRSVLLCKPENFKLQPINEIASEYIRRGDRIDPDRVRHEHSQFAEAIESVGAEIVWVEPQEIMPYQVFTRDIGVTTREGVLLGRFFLPIRQGEENEAVEVAKGHIPLWRTLENDEGIAFEGGDFMYMDEHTVALGIGARTTQAGAARVQAVMDEIDIEVILVPFDQRYLHIDMIFNVVGERVAIACPQALPPNFLKLVRERGFELNEETPEGVFKLNCNLLAVNNGVVISAAMNTAINKKLRSLGFEVIEVELHDLLMGGGGPHCMSFPLQRDG
jgi:N-dimethylarginine dimethylaminohydrolase